MGLVKWAATTCALGLLATSIQAQDAKPQAIAPVKADEAKPLKAALPVPPKHSAAQEADKTMMAPADEPVVEKPKVLHKKELEALPPKEPAKELLATKVQYDSYPTTRAPTAYAPYVPPKTFDVIASADGKTLHLVGTINAGATTILKTAIQKHLKAKTISLSSPGGNLVEGLAMAHVIRQFSLDTHVEFQCSSACTFVFLAGKNRIISPYAKIGFHQASNPLYYLQNSSGPVSESGNLMMRNAYTKAKIDEAIIERAMITPTSDYWYPETDALLNGNVATRLAKKEDIKLSVGNWKSAADMIEELNGEAIWRIAYALRPHAYYRVAYSIWEEKALEKKSYDIYDRARAGLAQMLLSDLEQYSDDIVDEYVLLENDIWKSDPYGRTIACGYTGGLFMPITNTENEILAKRQYSLLEKIAKIQVKPTADNKAEVNVAQANLMDFWGLMVASEQITSIDVPSKFCSQPKIYFAQLAKLPRDQRLSYIRAIARISKADARLIN